LSKIQVRYALPDPALFDLVPIYVELENSGCEAVDLLPPDMASLRIAVSGAWHIGTSPAALSPVPGPGGLFGATSRAQWVGGAGLAFCIGLNPLAWSALFGKRASGLHDRAVPLTEYLGLKWEELVRSVCHAPDFNGRVAATNRFLLELPKPEVREALERQLAAISFALADPDCGSVEELAARSGVSPRQLERIAKANFGFPPKLLIRRARFRRLLHRADAMSYSQWRSFLEFHYVDQSHMIRDFKYFMGMPPSRYFALDRPIVSAAFQSFWAMTGVKPGETRFAREAEAA
jgi:AraC-like DNA-binding protein